DATVGSAAFSTVRTIATVFNTTVFFNTIAAAFSAIVKIVFTFNADIFMVEVRNVKAVAVRVFVIIRQCRMRLFGYEVFEQIIIDILVWFENTVQPQVDQVIRFTFLYTQYIT